MNSDEQVNFDPLEHINGDITTMGGISTKTGEPIKYEGDADGYPIHINVIYDPPTGTWLVNSSEKDWENNATRC
ncbi:hypothetical protein [Gulosibacter bifidus]|uniref:Uncharacterized protein n=1 Tax=Gulosibacter bifidus TaxID=272239 RepID=A0ABW5RI15_9MICO|nr:hypothetical protein [Gulosibacter bifidus]